MNVEKSLCKSTNSGPSLPLTHLSRTWLLESSIDQIATFDYLSIPILLAYAIEIFLINAIEIIQVLIVFVSISMLLIPLTD